HGGGHEHEGVAQGEPEHRIREETGEVGEPGERELAGAELADAHGVQGEIAREADGIGEDEGEPRQSGRVEQQREAARAELARAHQARLAVASAAIVLSQAWSAVILPERQAVSSTLMASLHFGYHGW